MERIRRTWGLTTSSWAMLRRDKELIVLPLVGLVLALIVVGIVLGLVAATGGFDSEAADGLGGLHYLLFVVGGVTIAAITQFFAGAVVAGAIERMSGGDPTISSAIGGAGRRLTALVGWGAMDWTVGTVLRVVREEFGIIGRILAGLLDFAWAAVSFLVLPVIIVEGLGPVAALRRSTEMLRQTWGENVLAQFGFGIIGLAVAIPGIVLGAALMSVLPVLGIAVLIAWIVAVVCVMSALTSVFKAALYQYATSGQTDPVFGRDVAEAFRVR